MGHNERVDRAFVFTDIVSSLASLEQVGDGRWAEVIARQRRSVEAICHRNNGLVTGFTGDGFMLTFEAASDAVGCALRLQYALDVQGMVATRIGVATGSVIQLGEDYVGLAVNLAARFCQMSDAHSATIGDDCYRAALSHQAIPRLPLSETRVRGLGEPRPVRISRAHRGQWVA